MKIAVDQSSIGVGKTYDAIDKAVRFGGRWIFFVERIDFIAEVSDRIKDRARFLSVNAKVLTISSESNTKKRGAGVKNEIEALPGKYENGHVIVVCSHAGMLISDLRDFSDWHMVCDEVPSLLPITKMRTKLDVEFFKKYYELEEVATGWSAIKPTSSGRKLTGSDLNQDRSHNWLLSLHQTVLSFDAGKSCKVPVCNLTSWDDMSLDKVSWVWWSLFSVETLEAFSSVTFLASRFKQSFSFKVAEAWSKNIDWPVISKTGTRVFQPRRVSISYYSEKRNASKSFFGTDIGIKQLSKIATHIAGVTNDNKTIWSSNVESKKHLEPALGKANYLTPKQSGTDELMRNTHAVMIYAAKPSQEVKQVLSVIGAQQSDWIETNELEVILQFVSRISVRDANSKQDVSIHVYDKKQATYLFNFFASQGHLSTNLDFVDLNLKYPTKGPGRPELSLTPEEAKAHEVKARKKKSKRQKERRREARENKLDS